MKLDIKDLPSIGWMNKLNETRYFSGSVGISGSTGMFTVHTFHYRIWKKEVENEDGSKSKFFCVSCYIEPPQNSGLEAFGKEEETFAATDGAPQIILEWLNKQISKYSCIGQ